ncbi:hypothetical protein L2520_06380 [Limosilactobacillus vaginalis]|uniref:Polymerase n=1 Tax=Limosilactobacillus vaginalis TaxID=1633 RepID=A0ABT4K7U6_9LACO|nr:hypothetical protein [Limosilactobacillus vaginalis]MCZ3747038.1 hypothetical protein [Limosilactobacillus vaginalis]MCZ3751970.1 hypothetical protein [Limosilactobacillus vaginalis]MCZ3753707.1 hypothetical protein [Limosilactobacillus vaginalis]MCZ3755446.1 hypothetical protein [Limosilactobacillus vaginalis]MCZ3757141.1 hypothetical protein [Limosilactobacillus vaginalis]
MQYLSSKYQRLINLELDGQILYEVAFAFYFVIAFLQTSTYTSYFPGNLLHQIAFIPLAIVLFKIIFFDSNTVKKITVNLLFLAILFITWRTSGEFILFPMGIFILGARNVDFKKIIYLYLVLGTILLSFIFFTSLIGLTKNLIFHRGIHTLRRAFGIIYPTDFAAHILYLVLAYCYLYFNKLSWKSYTVFVLLAIFLIKFCDARLNAYALILVIPVMMIGQRAQKGYIVSRAIAIFYWVLPVLAAYITVLLSYLYAPSHQLLEKMNGLLSGRLFYSHEAIKKYGFSLLGQHIHENGYGAADGIKKTIIGNNYFYIDSAFVRLVIIYGIIMALLIVITMTIISYRSIQRANFALASIIVIITISAVVEQRLLDFGYNPFLIAIFAQCYFTNKLTGGEK